MADTRWSPLALTPCHPMMLNTQTLGIYIGKFPLSRLHHPQSVLFTGSAKTLSQTYSNCFDVSLNQLGFLQPSLTYVLSTDPCYQSIIAAASLSRRLDEVPKQYHRRGNTFYLFNVCTHPAYRGRGYMKDLLTRAFHDLRTYPRPPQESFQWSGYQEREGINWINPNEPTVIYLLVNHHNQIALNLYTRLGFQIIGSIDKPNGLHYLMIRHFPSLNERPRL